MARLSSTQVFGNLLVTGNTKISGELLVEGDIIGIDKTDVGLSNVDNTSDAAKPISTATQSALDGKANSSHNHTIGDVLGLQTALDDKLTTTGTAAAATKLATARTIGGVSFDGTANINLPGVNAVGNQNTTGSAATLTAARTINGTSFNGSANITTVNWGTARTLTIGGSGKSVNGSQAVSWSLSEIGAAPINHAHPIATPTEAGYMSAADKIKLDELAAAPPIELPAILELFSNTVQVGDVLVFKADPNLTYDPTSGGPVPTSPAFTPLGLAPLFSRVSGTIKFKVEYSWNPGDPKYGADFYHITLNGELVYTVKCITGIQEFVFNISPGDVLSSQGLVVPTKHALTYNISSPGLYCDKAYMGVFM